MERASGFEPAMSSLGSYNGGVPRAVGARLLSPLHKGKARPPRARLIAPNDQHAVSGAPLLAMSYKSDSERRSENHNPASSNYGDASFPEEDDEKRSPEDWFLEGGDLGAPDLSVAPWGSARTARNTEKSNDSEAEGLSFALSERIELLQGRIEALQKDIAKRGALHRSIRRAVQEELIELGHLLGEVKVWSLGVSPSVDGRRTNLEREAIALRKAGWEERLRHWRDIVWLEKELSEALERYKLAGAARGLTGDDSGKG